MMQNVHQIQQQQPFNGGGSAESSSRQTAAMIWAQENRFVDSGIHTAALPSSNASSSIISGSQVSAHFNNKIFDDQTDYGNVVGGGGGFYPSSGQGQLNYSYNLDDINADYESSRSNRIRAAMFPETLSEPLPGAPYDVGQSVNVQQLAEPSQLLKMAVVNLVNYQEDAQLTRRILPNLVELLNDNDTVVAQKAAQFVHHISKQDAVSAVLANEHSFMNAMMSLTNSSKDPSTVKYAVGALYNLSGGNDGRLAIFRSGGIEALIKLLDSPVDRVLFYATTTLHNLILHQPGAQDAIRKLGGVPKMVNCLKKHNNAKFLAILIDCLYNLSLNNQEVKSEILRLNGTAQLLQILNSSCDYERLLWTTCRLMQALSVCEQNKKFLIANGILQSLNNRLNIKNSSHKLICSILLLLRNLSDLAVKCDQVEQLLIQILRLMSSNDLETVLYCAGILSNMSCNNIRNKATIHRNGGVGCLLRSLEAFEPLVNNNPPLVVDLLESVLCTLRHITNRHPEADVAQNELRLYRSSSAATASGGLTTPSSSNGLHLIARFANPAAQWPMTLVRPALGVIRNVADLPANAQPLHESGMTNFVCIFLSRFHNHFQQAQRQSVQPPLVDGIKCVDMIDVCTAVLQTLCKFPANRLFVRQTNVVPILVQLLYFDMESIQQFSAGTLTEIAADVEGCQQIEQNGAVAQLTELLHSRNEHIATYAAAVLHALSQTKPPEYQQHLGVELTSSLFRDDSTPWSQDVLNDMPQVNEDVFNTYNGYDHSNYDGYAPSPGNLMDYDSVSSGGAGVRPVGGVGAPPPSVRSAQQPQPALTDWYDTNL